MSELSKDAIHSRECEINCFQLPSSTVCTWIPFDCEGKINCFQLPPRGVWSSLHVTVAAYGVRSGDVLSSTNVAYGPAPK
eukprot:1008963-Rhodomonas_salina.1